MGFLYLCKTLFCYMCSCVPDSVFAILYFKTFVFLSLFLQKINMYYLCPLLVLLIKLQTVQVPSFIIMSILPSFLPQSFFLFLFPFLTFEHLYYVLFRYFNCILFYDCVIVLFIHNIYISLLLLLIILRKCDTFFYTYYLNIYIMHFVNLIIVNYLTNV